MNAMPRTVSVVIPAYNNADHLEATIRSVLAQDYDDFELIIADHSSTDATRQVMDAFSADERVTLLTTEAGGGAKRNWDRVSQAASGTYLKLLPGDDIIYPAMLREQVAALEAHPSAVLAATSRDVLNPNGAIVIKNRGLNGLIGLHDGKQVVRALVRAGSNVLGEPGCVMIRRDALEQGGWWDDRFPYLIDEATYARVLATGDFVGVQGPLAAFRLSAGQWSARLIDEQAGQAKAFHDSLLVDAPGTVSAADVRYGNLRAKIAARGRRLAYIYIGAKLRKSAR
jgi:glycosyltransferase involved in cell wall biosynthesis